MKMTKLQKQIQDIQDEMIENYLNTKREEITHTQKLPYKTYVNRFKHDIHEMHQAMLKTLYPWL